MHLLLCVWSRSLARARLAKSNVDSVVAFRVIGLARLPADGRVHRRLLAQCSRLLLLIADAVQPNRWREICQAKNRFE